MTSRILKKSLNLNLSLSRVLLILFFAVLVGGAISHDSVALGAQETPPAVDPGYRLGAEDVMVVSVWKDEHLTKEVVVRPDGSFSFPQSTPSGRIARGPRPQLGRGTAGIRAWGGPPRRCRRGR